MKSFTVRAGVIHEAMGSSFDMVTHQFAQQGWLVLGLGFSLTTPLLGFTGSRGSTSRRWRWCSCESTTLLFCSGL